jgi:hypothetical protein
VQPRLWIATVVLGAAAAGGAASAADEHAHHHQPPSAETPVEMEAAPAAQMPYATPRETLIPGLPGMPGGLHLMVNAFAHLQNVGLDGHAIANPDVAQTFDGGATRPLLQDDWVMGYGRDGRGRVEGIVMLNLEPLTIGPAGIPELGQAGEGLWDAQHSHQLLHQAMVAVHPLAWTAAGEANMGFEPAWDLALFAGQGSATIGPPIFMHRASSPGPTVPRKHHKGENPHETSPVLGASLRRGATTIDASIFGAVELHPQDSRFYPHPAAPRSAAARLRQVLAGAVELQVSGERLRAQGGGEPDAWQASASAYLWGTLAGLRVDALLDWGLDLPDGGPSAQGALAEVALRTAALRDVFWLRTELNQREEAPGAAVEVSGPWLFQTVGFEHVNWVSPTSGLQVGLFGEATYARIPDALAAGYGRSQAVTVNVGLHVFGMAMLDGDLNRMAHHHH